MPAKVVMIQGTTSHAGKSVLTAALCRIYARRGLRVAPFKAQNMALNSYVTPEGGEIGRAQAYQAAAAGIEPHVDMNPILLKPNSQTGSQVIILGKPLANMAVREYHAFQKTVWPTVTAALDRLREQYDLVVIEGAGSPAEINLREQDIVNMKVARYANCPVLLVGDIDRGGVFASLLGTTLLVTDEEKALIKAFIINKFRGDASLLDSGLTFIQQRTGIPTLGVIPYLQNWHGEEEDSLGVEDRRRRKKDAPLVIAVVRLPFISNFTDFDALADEEDVAVRYALTPTELEGADALILPGTKSTIDDLGWLRQSGMADALLHQVGRGIPLIGICGGYQMLGRSILDPYGVESATPEIAGLGLLPVDTEFAGEKRTVRAQGQLTGGALAPVGTPAHGYEIHMGHSTLAEGTQPLLALRDAEGKEFSDGAVAGQVCGTYLHGLFDHPLLRRRWLNRLRERKGLAPLPEAENAILDIDRLADHVTAYLDMEQLERIIGIADIVVR
ncbi:MAG: cobyric acid synthase [Armatimonadota bacterium]